MFLTVYLSNNDQHVSEVPVTPETLCRDVVELCKEPGEAECYLAEMWRDSGEPPTLYTSFQVSELFAAALPFSEPRCPHISRYDYVVML